MRLTSRTLPALVLACAAALAGTTSPVALAEDALPPGVVARVYGEDITEDQLNDRLARRFEETKRGRELLDQMIEDLCVAREAQRRGVEVPDADARRYMEEVDKKVRFDSGGTKSLADVFTEQQSSEAEFLESVHEFLLRQKMAREDMGDGGAGASQFGIDGDLPMHRIKLWVKSIRARTRVETEGLPDGVMARVDGRDVTREAFATSISSRFPPEVTRGLLDDLIFELAAAHHLKQAGIEVGQEDVDAEVDRVRRRFLDDPRVKGSGVTFEQFLQQSRGTGEAELRQDPKFLARLGVRKLLLPRVTQKRIREHWELNRDAYGEQALLRQFFVPARRKDSEVGIDKKLRTFPEAYEYALQVKVAILRAAGVSGAREGDRPPMALPDAVAAVAGKLEQNPSRKEQAGQPEVWTRARVAGERGLVAKVFEGELGVLMGPVRSSVGCHLLVVEERRPAPRFEEIQDKLREDVLRSDMLGWRRAMKLGGDVVTRSVDSAPK